MRFDRAPSPFAGSSTSAQEPRTVALRTEIPVEERALLAGAERRMVGAMWVITVAGTITLWFSMRWDRGLGFLAGAVLSVLNFRWLKSAVTLASDVLSSTAPEGEPRPDRKASMSRRRWPVLARFFLRYGLIAVVGYAIFLSSATSLMAFLLGLFTSVAGLMMEAAYQVFEATFRSSRGRQ